MFYFQLPAAERAIAHDDYVFIEDWIRDSAPDWDIPREMIEGIKDTYRRPGVLDAVLAYYRHNVNPALQDPALKELQQHVSTAPITVPTLAFHGSPERPGRLEVFHGMDWLFTGGLEKVVGGQATSSTRRSPSRSTPGSWSSSSAEAVTSILPQKEGGGYQALSGSNAIHRYCYLGSIGSLPAFDRAHHGQCPSAHEANPLNLAAHPDPAEGGERGACGC